MDVSINLICHHSKQGLDWLAGVLVRVSLRVKPWLASKIRWLGFIGSIKT